MNTYEIDTLVQLQSAFVSDPGGVPTDPITVNLYVQDPNGVETEYSQAQLVHLGPGVWAIQIEVSVSGPWIYKFQGEGNLIATSPDTYFLVNPSVLIPG